ncbi:uncharacterized protein [Solanum lycopersicum]|uniref:uncharacterized protein n=1 Tax=Solanum lycopersicum TaxID=4081 RepID=UPI003748E97A
MVADMRRRMSLFVVWLSGFPNKKGKAPMLIGYVDIGRLMIHVQQVEDDKLRDREEFKNKRVKALGNESGQQKSRVSRSSVQHKHKRPTPSSVHLHQGTKTQDSMAQGGTKTPACVKCGESHSVVRPNGSTGCFKCCKNNHVMRECPENRKGNGNGAIEPRLFRLKINFTLRELIIQLLIL